MLFLSWHMRIKKRNTYSPIQTPLIMKHMQRPKRNHYLSPNGHNAYIKKRHQLECIAKLNPRFLVARHTYKKHNNY